MFKDLLVLGIVLWLAIPQLLAAYGFDIMQLPAGKSVTLPRPATTLVPLDSEVRLTATDHGQSVKLSSVANMGKGAPFSVAIYDSLSEKARTVTLSPGGSVLYQFLGINTIRILPKIPKAKNPSGLRLQIESNKPLGISR